MNRRRIAQDRDDLADRARRYHHSSLHCQPLPGRDPVAPFEAVRNPGSIGRNQFNFPATHDAVAGMQKMHGVNELILQEHPDMADVAHTAAPYQQRAGRDIPLVILEPGGDD